MTSTITPKRPYNLRPWKQFSPDHYKKLHLSTDTSLKIKIPNPEPETIKKNKKNKQYEKVVIELEKNPLTKQYQIQKKQNKIKLPPVSEFFKLNSNEALTFQKVAQSASFESFMKPKNHEEINEELIFSKPDSIEKNTDMQIEKINLNNDETEELEIVDNQNKKVKIKVSRTLQKIKKNFEEIPNKIDLESRNQNFQTQSFTQDFKSGYAPIEVQENQEKDFSNIANKGVHFIKKKQSCASINLKRTCGVSYVKETESQQANVSHIFQKLPPLIFQCSSECNDEELLEEENKQLFNQIFNPTQGFPWLLCTILETDDQIIREYLLRPEKRFELANGNYFLAENILDIWPLFLDKYFLIIHFIFDSEKTIISPTLNEINFKSVDEAIRKSDLQLGFLFKKNISGKKTFVKTLGTEFNDEINKMNEKCEKPIEIDLPKREKSERKPSNFLNSLFLTVNNFFGGLSTATNSHEGTPSKSLIPEDKPKTELQTKISSHLIEYLKKEPKGININTCSVRMELFIQEYKWHQISDLEKNKLNKFIMHIESSLQELNLEMMGIRMECSDKKDWNFYKESCEKLRKITNQINIKSDIYKTNIIQNTAPLEFFPKFNLNNIFSKELFSLSLPLYYISTRDCFAFDLIEKKTIIKINGRSTLKTEFFFNPKAVPQNFKTFKEEFPDYRVGVTTYQDFFNHEELLELEKCTYETEIKCFKKHFLPMTAQATFTSEKVRRTKFFFGVRYMWSKQQLSEPFSNIGAGVRCDVSPPPNWLKSKIEKPLVDGNIIPPNFINSITMNVYHDGKEGLAQHFDDAVRFKQPIFSLRLFSDCRLSFGSQFYGFCNGAFCIPLPRGCICVMEENSYAANGVKHCVRPCDMTGKSAAIILRQMHEKCLIDAKKLDEFVDFPAWFSTLSCQEDAVSYEDQKKMEADKNCEGKNIKISNSY